MRAFAIITVAATLAACAPEKPEVISRTRAGDKAQVAVVVADESFTLEDVNQRLEVMPDWARARFASMERKKTFLATTVQFELLHDDAQRLGYDKHPDTIHRLERKYVDAWLDEQIHKEPMSNEVLKKHFEANIDAFRRGEARKVYILQTFTQERAQTLRERILEAPAPERVATFRETAEHFSTDFPSRQHQGSVGAISRDGEFAPADDSGFYRVADDNTGDFVPTAWKLTEGEVSEPLEMGGRYLIVMWSGTIPPEDVAFDDVVEQVREHLLQHRRDQLIASYQ